jgi:ribokinase
MTMPRAVPKIAVIGSINMDLVIRCGRFPEPGETVLAESSAEICGGKGANQAVAAARAGGDVLMVGRVGDDAFAGRLRDNLVAQRIDCQAVMSTDGSPSGLAVVMVRDDGQNSILVVSGANGRLSIDDVRAHAERIRQCDVVLMQLEIPIETVETLIPLIRGSCARVILDPAPVPPRWSASLAAVDLICPNETEASQITGVPVETIEQVEAAAKALHQMGAANVAITLGAKGTLFYDGHQAHLIEPIAVNAVDTTAAGDAFAGALAVRWAETDDLIDAIRFANAAGGIAASRPGAQPAMGSRQEIEDFYRTLS